MSTRERAKQVVQYVQGNPTLTWILVLVGALFFYNREREARLAAQATLESERRTQDLERTRRKVEDSDMEAQKAKRDYEKLKGDFSRKYSGK